MTTDYHNSLEFARKMDSEDPLRTFRQRFIIPKRGGKECIYFCGNSLGLQPVDATRDLGLQMENWAQKAVEGHFEGDDAWMTLHKKARGPLARLLGARENEVVAMNNLSTNLHLMMVTFFRPRGKRKKILMESGAFPSDQYAVESHLRWHGLDPAECIIEVLPDIGDSLYSTEHILREIEKAGEEIALVLFGGIQYYSGQLFDMAAITKKAHEIGAVAGFDLAHAMGNVPLHLHEWGVDFAAWCSYKYLNSGPGGISGVYIHERHATDKSLPRFGGWWGHNEKDRFLMKKGFDPIESADGWQLSNAPVMLLATHLTSLGLFQEAGMENLRKKSIALTGFLEFLLKNQVSTGGLPVKIITPSDAGQRGCQLSLYVTTGNKSIFDAISRRGVIADWREPNVIRIAPTPLYNTFVEVYQFVNILTEEWAKLK